MKDFRCGNCKRLLAKIDGKGRVDIVCPKCKSMNVISEVIDMSKEDPINKYLNGYYEKDHPITKLFK